MRCASTSDAAFGAERDRLYVNWSTRTDLRCYSRIGAGSRPHSGMLGATPASPDGVVLGWGWNHGPRYETVWP